MCVYLCTGWCDMGLFCSTDCPLPAPTTGAPNAGLWKLDQPVMDWCGIVWFVMPTVVPTAAVFVGGITEKSEMGEGGGRTASAIHVR